jgi:hypothetical protein
MLPVHLLPLPSVGSLIVISVPLEIRITQTENDLIWAKAALNVHHFHFKTYTLESSDHNESRQFLSNRGKSSESPGARRPSQN